ncbi:PEP-CTERM sorting domain-containing protein [Leptolyngbya sp. AN02str]|uniref:PEP-CTERM sorting domain-containing protein n=1 Tax=Leptolyngbya sp. AN02str TaxID=3423363 RepID=UPI003D318A55
MSAHRNTWVGTLAKTAVIATAMITMTGMDAYAKKPVNPGQEKKDNPVQEKKEDSKQEKNNPAKEEANPANENKGGPAQETKSGSELETSVGTLCKTTDVSLSGGIFASACAGSFSGNDTGAQGTLLNDLNNGLFSTGGGTWSLLGKSDDGGFSAGKSSTGGWSLLGGQQITGSFVLSLKAGNAYSAYYFDNVSNVTSGFFDTIGVSLAGNGKSGKDLSHASIFVLSQDTTPTPPPAGQPVPEPFTILGTVAAAGMGYRMKQARKAAKRDQA